MVCHFSFKWSTHPNLNFGAKNRHSNLYYLPFFQFSSLTCWSWGSMLGSQVEGLEFDSWSDQRPFFPKICKKGGKIQIALIISLEREVAHQTGNFFWPLYRKNSLDGRIFKRYNYQKYRMLLRLLFELQWMYPKQIWEFLNKHKNVTIQLNTRTQKLGKNKKGKKWGKKNFFLLRSFLFSFAALGRSSSMQWRMRRKRLWEIVPICN